MFLKIWNFPNPLESSRNAIDCIYVAGETYRTVFNRVGISTGCQIWADGKAIDVDSIVNADVVATTRKVESPVDLAFLFIELGVSGTYAVAAANFISSALVTIGVTLISSAVFAPDRPVEFKGEQSGNAFSVTNSGNRAKAYGALPVVMGNHRFSPDLDCRPWVHFVPDPDNKREQTVNETYTEKSCSVALTTSSSNPFDFSLKSCPAWTEFSTDPEWVQIETNIWRNKQQISIGTVSDYLFGIEFVSQDPSLNKPAAMLHDTSTGLYQLEGTTKWGTLDEVHPVITYTKEVKKEASETTQELTQCFNFGLGDLSYSDLRLGQTEIENFNGVTLSVADFQDDATLIGVDATHPNPPFGNWQLNVVMVDGGSLRQNDSVPNDGWIERDYYGNDCVFIEVDIAGTLYRQGNEGFESASCQVAIEYKEKASSTWISRPTVSLVNGDTFPVRETIGWAVPEGQYEVRVRKITTDSTDAREQNSIDAPQIKFFRPEPYDASNPLSNHPAQNRVAIAVRASGQINGTIDEFNAYVSAKCWVYTGTAWDGTFPGGSGNWAWKNTENPAWWYLYTVMGIYRRSAPNPGHPTDGKGWTVGRELADGPRLYGAGIQNSRINFESIIVWAKFCEAYNLRFNAVVTEQTSVQDLLNRISRIGRASPSWYSGKLGAIFEDPASPVSMHFGMPSIIAGSFSCVYVGDQSPEEIVVGYTEPNDQWREAEVRRVVPGYVLPHNETKVSLFGCKYKEQAQREANLLAARQFYQRRRVVFETTAKGLPVYRGDVISVAHDLFDWAYSGRVYEISGNTITLSRNIEEAGVMSVQIQKPDGTIINTTGTAEGNQLTVAATLDLNEFPDAIPEDWHVYAGVQGTGKKMRVISVDPTDSTKIKITCTDEAPEMWSAEWNGVIGELPVSGQRIIARAFNASLEKTECSEEHVLRWELSGARMADVQISRNGLIGTLRVHGDSLHVGAITGPFSATITPVAELVTVGVESASLAILH